MKRCPHCNGSLVSPRMTPKQVVAALRLVQLNHPPIYHWPDAELQRLEQFLQPGDEIDAIFACSVRVVRAAGGPAVEFARRDDVAASMETGFSTRRNGVGAA
jgi:hypothetical protein